MHTSQQAQKAFSYAFPKTIPVMIGYLFLGFAYGILMKINGFGWGWTLACSLLIYAGSLQYVGVTLLSSLVNPISAFFLGLMINARHLFYGISMLLKYRNLESFRTYLIASLTDETFSIVCNEEIPENLSSEWFYFWVSFLDHCYWITGSVVGCLVGGMIRFNTKGLDFALTALFVVIFTDQWKSHPDHIPAISGILCSIISILCFGRSSFIVPAMIMIFLVLMIRYRMEVKSHE